MDDKILIIEIFSHERIRETINSLKSKLFNNFKDRDEEFTLCLDNDMIPIELSKLLFNLILFQFHTKRNIKFIKDDLWLENYLKSNVLKKHFDNMIINYELNNIDLDSTREDICAITDELTELSALINREHGQTLSLLDFIQSSKDPEIKDQFYPKIEFGMSFNEVENKFKESGKAFLQYYKNHPEKEIYPMAVSDCGMNAQQFTQCCGFVGTKPDIDGNIIPYIISSNYLTGLKSNEDIYISAKGCRKATIFGKNNVKKSGYLTQKLSLLMIDKYNDDNLEDCGTNYFIKYDVNSQEKLDSIRGRHYYLIDQSTLERTSDLKSITGSENYLVGLTIGLRSPVTCSSKHVCKTCYGKHLAAVNSGLNTGLIATYLLTDPLTQMMLSAKHLLKTETTPVDWGELKDVMIANMEKLYFDTILPTEIILDIPREDQFDEEEDNYFFTDLKIIRGGITTEYQSPEPLYINPKIYEKCLDEENEIIKISYRNDEEWIFKYFVRNNELLKSLQEVVDLIENGEHLGITNYHTFVNKFIDLCLHNRLGNIMSVHLEMITSTLLFKKDSDDVLDFNVDIIADDDYTIERVSSAVMKGPLSTALTFERINEQLANPKTYKKSKPSLMDRLFL